LFFFLGMKDQYIDDQSWISVHAYVLQNWNRITILLNIKKVIEKDGSNKVTKMIKLSFL
jgi:hypothetical protein